MGEPRLRLGNLAKFRRPDFESRSVWFETLCFLSGTSGLGTLQLLLYVYRLLLEDFKAGKFVLLG